jgi:hypothetical protein
VSRLSSNIFKNPYSEIYKEILEEDLKSTNVSIEDLIREGNLDSAYEFYKYYSNLLEIELELGLVTNEDVRSHEARVKMLCAIC